MRMITPEGLARSYFPRRRPLRCAQFQSVIQTRIQLGERSAWGEQVNRRQLLVAGLFYVGDGLADAQEIPQNTDTRPVEDEEELWFLLSALDTLIFLMTDGVLKEPKEVARTIQEFQPYGAQFAESNAIEAFNSALLSNEGRARVDDGTSRIAAATQRTTTLFSDVISSAPVRDTISKSFSRASTLLLARSAENARWWCNCYGLKVINC
jgi:hypothetical protein